jgi:hypothetical protein
MAVLVVVLVSLVLFGGLGALGVGALSPWHDVVAGPVAATFLFVASAHFTRTREDLVAIVPRAFPMPGLLVSLLAQALRCCRSHLRAVFMSIDPVLRSRRSVKTIPRRPGN